MAVVGKEQIFSLLRARHAELRQLGVRRYGLFGSFIRNEQQPESDIDLLVEFDPQRKNFQRYMQLVFLLEDVLGRKVDVVTPESLSPYIGPHILNEVEYVVIST